MCRCVCVCVGIFAVFSHRQAKAICSMYIMYMLLNQLDFTGGGCNRSESSSKYLKALAGLKPCHDNYGADILVCMDLAE